MAISMTAYLEFIERAKRSGDCGGPQDMARLRRAFLRSQGVQVQEVLPTVEAEPAEPAPVNRPEIYKGPSNPGRRKDYYWERF